MSKQTELAQVADTITVDSGNVGIGTSSPAAPLHVAGTIADNPAAVGVLAGAINNFGNVKLVGSAGGYIDFTDTSAGQKGRILYTVSDNAMSFRTNGANERMRIDSSGNLLVGKTSQDDAGTAGITLAANNTIYAARSSASPLLLNRLSSDGGIISFRKDGSTVGSIGTETTFGTFTIKGDGDSGFFFGNGFILPIGTTGAIQDNAVDLGNSAVRFDDIFATNGTIQTSDRNEKQDIAELSDAEQRVAVAAKGLMRKFRWRDAVEAKGDEARTHFGIIAQDLQAAFAAEGLDAGDYAMFISSTWWETQTEVPAVEAVAEVLDEDGNVVTEAVEVADAYTRTDTYDTQEEAPEGATERTRLGVRYSELLAFIIGAL